MLSTISTDFLIKGTWQQFWGLRSKSPSSPNIYANDCHALKSRADTRGGAIGAIAPRSQKSIKYSIL